MPVQWTMRRWVVICPIPSVLVMCVKLNGNRTCHENWISQLNRPDFHAKLCPSLFKYSSTVCRLHKLRSETELSCRPLHMEIILFGSLVIIEWNGVTESWCVCFNEIPAACLSFGLIFQHFIIPINTLWLIQVALSLPLSWVCLEFINLCKSD